MSLKNPRHERFSQELAVGKSADEASAAVAALTAKAKLAGLWIERGEHSNTNVNYAVSDEPPSESEWVRRHVTEH